MANDVIDLLTVEGQRIDTDVVVTDLEETESIVSLDFLDTHQSIINTEQQGISKHLIFPYLCTEGRSKLREVLVLCHLKTCIFQAPAN